LIKEINGRRIREEMPGEVSSAEGRWDCYNVTLTDYT
jgi:hypothetical protein